MKCRQLFLNMVRFVWLFSLIFNQQGLKSHVRKSINFCLCQILCFISRTMPSKQTTVTSPRRKDKRTILLIAQKLRKLYSTKHNLNHFTFYFNTFWTHFLPSSIKENNDLSLVVFSILYFIPQLFFSGRIKGKPLLWSRLNKRKKWAKSF